jgi:hypothetical protein
MTVKNPTKKIAAASFVKIKLMTTKTTINLKEFWTMLKATFLLRLGNP